ncbi:MAG: DoxX family membrane protein [Lacinutrix sp.]|uniref:DoxX family membrane protein n=1 Tax=Lacinutrix sp. TaxID=1937692 RepID=UPI0030B12903
MIQFEEFYSSIYKLKLFKIFTWFMRVLLAIAFIPSGFTKLLGNRFTLLPMDNTIGFFFEALFRTGFYWNFLGFMQHLVALLLIIPRTLF